EFMPKMVEQLRPEAAYFTTDRGMRTAYFFVDMKESSQMPAVAEPFFQELNATVEMIPCMNADDLRKGLGALEKRR
ncbi:MAG TPA: hypothetical protein VGX75_12450, partial [bacterium]|nr:hypothetical protein [bacterium]